MRLAAARRTSGSWFQVTFQCHKAFITLPQVPGLEFSHNIDRQGAPVDLGFAMIGRDGHWRISAEYATEVFTEATIDRMLRHFQTLLEGIAQTPINESRICLS